MIHICGRKVRVLTGQPGKADKAKQQTVRICTKENIVGKYDYVLRLYSPDFTSESELESQRFQSIEACVKYLKEKYHASTEQLPADNISLVSDKPKTSSLVTEVAKASLWEERASKIVEENIDQFILEFIEFPYLHRREHSIHCELYKLLANSRILGGHYPMGRRFSQLIHKEWPESFQRRKKSQRGTFDLCILSPEILQNCNIEEFLCGRIAPAIAIEFGLDYNLKHLQNDLEKLSESRINFGYIIHLLRQNFSDDYDAVERLILKNNTNVKTAYARLTSYDVFYKLTNDSEIKRRKCHD